MPLCWIGLRELNRNFGSYAKVLSAVDKGWYHIKQDKKDTTVQINDQTVISLADFQYVYLPDFPQIPGDCVEPITASQLDAYFNAKHKKLFEPRTPSCVFWTYRDEYLLPATLQIDAFVSAPDVCIPLQQMFLLAGIPKIGASIQEARELGATPLRNLLDRVAKHASKHVSSIWQEYKNLEIKLELNGDSINASVVDHFNRYDFSDRSDGFKRFISLLLVLSAQAKNSTLKNCLILLDEAENALHPSSVRYLRDELIRVSENNTVVCSTHSIFMVDKTKIDRHLIVKKHKEITTVIPVDHTNIFEEEVVYNALNYSVFENLRPFNLVFEGWRDKRLFEYALAGKDQASDHYVSLNSLGKCHLQGVNDAGRVVPMLELAGRQYLVISDADDAAKQAKKRFSNKQHWQMYTDLGADQTTVVTAEDFLSAELLNPILADLATRLTKEPLELNDLPNRRPRMSSIRSWIQSTLRQEGDQLKETLDGIKEAAFLALNEKHILPSYDPVLDGILSHVNAQTAASMAAKPAV